jgi:uncharacterized protein
MIIPDVNVLVYAFHADEPQHGRYRNWLERTVNGGEAFGLVDASLIGFIRIVTKSRIYSDPAPTASAVAFVSALVGSDASRWIGPNRSTWEAFHTIVGDDHRIKGSLVRDAWLAAIALSNGCRLATADRGFGRFEGLDWFDPGR